MRNFIVRNTRKLASLLFLCANVGHFPMYAAHDIERDRSPSVDCREYIMQPFYDDPAASDCEWLCGSVPECFGSAIVDLSHVDTLMLDARVIERSDDQFQAFAGLDGFASSIIHDGFPFRDSSCIWIYDPQAGPFFYSHFAG